MRRPEEGAWDRVVIADSIGTLLNCSDMPYTQIYKLIERTNIREYSVFAIRIQPDSGHL